MASKIFINHRRDDSIGIGGRLPVRPLQIDDEIAGEYVPNVRIADSPAIIALFEGTAADKLLPLLEAEKLSSWARPMGSGQPPLAMLPVEIWKCHHLEFCPKNDEHRWQNQTFIQTNARSETIYYDAHLNERQIEQVWPDLLKDEMLPLMEAAAQAYEQTRENPAALMAEASANTNDDIITWYCCAMAAPGDHKTPSVSIWGTRPPSRLSEPISHRLFGGYDFIIENQSLILKERGGKGRYEDLSVKTRDAYAAIASIGGWEAT
jgi:hypothetical protein